MAVRGENGKASVGKGKERSRYNPGHLSAWMSAHLCWKQQSEGGGSESITKREKVRELEGEREKAMEEGNKIMTLK